MAYLIGDWWLILPDVRRAKSPPVSNQTGRKSTQIIQAVSGKDSF